MLIAMFAGLAETACYGAWTNDTESQTEELISALYSHFDDERIQEILDKGVNPNYKEDLQNGQTV